MTEKIIREKITNVNPDITESENMIDQLARRATVGTLKKIFTASGDEKIRQFCQSIHADYSTFDNNDLGKNFEKSISEAYDIHLAVYTYLYEQIIVNGLTADTEITKTLKSGKEKVKTVFQWACTKARRYIYSRATAEIYNSTKTVKHADGTKTQYKTIGYTYIEDLSNSEDETGMEALDREYIRMGKYNGIQTYNDYVQYSSIMELFADRPQMVRVIKMRMRGISVTNIAEKMNVTQQAISKQLEKAQKIISDKYPELIRGFKDGRSNKNNTPDTSKKFWTDLMKNNF